MKKKDLKNTEKKEITMSEKKTNKVAAEVLGRPTKYSEALAARICEIVSSSPNGIKKTCKLHPEMPTHDTIHQWRIKYQSFSEQYDAAMYKQSTAFFVSSVCDLEELEDCVYTNPTTGAQEINSGMVAYKKALSDRKAKHAAILSKKFRIEKETDTSETEDRINKVREMAADINKTNASDI